MIVDYSGWNKDTGHFCHKIYIDESKKDYAVYFENGSVARQTGEFHHHTADWNHDDDVYTQYGAWFEFRAADGSRNGGEFFTPEDLVRFAVDALDPDSSRFGPRVTKVDGVEIPVQPRHPSLDQRLAQIEARAMHQDMERNRKMAALGIRPPNEPWAR